MLLAEIFNVCIDHLLIDGTPANSSTPPKRSSAPNSHNISELGPDDLAALRNIIDALIAKTRLHALARGTSLETNMGVVRQ